MFGKNCFKNGKLAVSKTSRLVFCLTAVLLIFAFVVTAFSVTFFIDRENLDRARAEDNAFFSSENDPIWIRSWQQLMNIGNETWRPRCLESGDVYGKYHTKNGFYALANDIVIPAGEWLPFSSNIASGQVDSAFVGTFDGRGRTIYFEQNATISAPENFLRPFGIFSILGNGSIVKDLNIYVPDTTRILRTTNHPYTAILAGQIRHSRVENVHIRGGGVLEVTQGGVNALGNIGGLAGMVSAGSIIGQASSSVNIYAPNSNSVGGLIGDIFTIVGFRDIYASGSVTGHTTVGGLVGRSQSAIVRAYATGNVTGVLTVGGLVGAAVVTSAANAGLSDTFATGKVTASGSTVGGLVGNLAVNTNRSWASGDVTGGTFVGGFAGVFNGGGSNNAAFGNVTSIETGVAANPGGIAGAFAGGLASTPTNAFASGNVASLAVDGYVALGGFSGSITGTRVLTSVASATTSITTAGATAVAGSLVGLHSSTISTWNNLALSYQHIMLNGELLHNHEQNAGEQNTGGDYQDDLYQQTPSQTPSQTPFTNGHFGRLANNVDIRVNTDNVFRQVEIEAFLNRNTFNNAAGANLFTVANWSFYLEEGGYEHLRAYLPSNHVFPVPNSRPIQISQRDVVLHYITNVQQLRDVGSGRIHNGVAFGVNDRYRLANNIVITAECGFTPITRGTALGVAFGGVFDGNHHTITIADSLTFTGANIGIFGAVYGANIHNLNIHLPEGVTFGGAAVDNIGLLVGWTRSTSLNNIHISGRGTILGRNQVGGVVGYTLSISAFREISTTIDVRGHNNVGGAFGNLRISNTAYNSWASGNVVATGSNVGGLAGASTSSHPVRSAAFGNVTGANVVGGLIGAVANTAGARYSFALGDVTVTNANNAAVVYAGGFIAHSGGGNAASIFESFSYGNVISLATSGTQNLGGFVGRINSASIRFTGNVSMARQIITHPDHIGTLNIAPVVASSRLALNATALYYEGFKHIVGDGATLVSQTHAAHLPVSRDYFKDINTFINLGWDFGIQGFIMDDGHLTEPLTGVPTYHFYMIGYYICADRSGHIYRYTGLPMHRFMHPRYANRVNFVWSGTGGEFANGLSNAQTLQQLRVASFNARVANPLRVGYTFTGWYNMPSCAGIGGVENNAHEIITSLQRLINVDGSINCVYLLGQIFFARGGTVFNFYAHWSVNIGTMRFVCLANGITKTQNLPGASFMVATGVGLDCIMEISNVARSGYILKGFYFGGIRIFNADGSVANSLNGGIVPYKAYEFLLEAVWEQIQFSAAFYALGNRLYCLDTVTNYYAGFGVVLPTLYKTSSHYFVGWQVANSELGIQNSELLQAGQVIVLSADVLFVAVWQFRSFGVAFEGHYEVYSLDKVLLYGSIVILPELVVARENYEFVGWLVNGELTSVGVQIAIYVDTTILAVWAFVEPPIEDYPVCDYPVCDYPILDCPVDDYPLCDYPICEYPIVDCPIDDYPVDDCPVDDYPVDECPVDDYPILDCPVEDYPVDDYPIIDYPADDYPTIDLPNYDCCEYPELCEACAAEQNTRRSNWWLLYIIGGCAGGTGLYGAYRAVADSRRRRLL